jgi:hypothetical protein
MHLMHESMDGKVQSNAKIDLYVRSSSQ